MDKEFDFATAKRPHEVPALAKMREIREQHMAKNLESTNDTKPINLIDDDVWQLIGQHAQNAQDIARMNSIIRVLFA